MIRIQRRYNGTDWEHIATYDDTELTGDEDFIESFGYLFEGEVDESAILRQFDGPNLVAELVETDSE